MSGNAEVVRFQPQQSAVGFTQDPPQLGESLRTKGNQLRNVFADYDQKLREFWRSFQRWNSVEETNDPVQNAVGVGGGAQVINSPFSFRPRIWISARVLFNGLIDETQTLWEPVASTQPFILAAGVEAPLTFSIFVPQSAGRVPAVFGQVFRFLVPRAPEFVEVASPLCFVAQTGVVVLSRVTYDRYRIWWEDANRRDLNTMAATLHTVDPVKWPNAFDNAPTLIPSRIHVELV